MIIHADILDWAASYDGPPFHALLCDPPYHLTEIVKRFGKEGSAPAQHGTDGAFQRVSKGFMGKTWDGGDVAYRPETWAALTQHLYPGAFGMAFSGSRGWHRMAVAIEGLVGIPITSLKSVSDLLALAIETRKWDLVEEAKRFVDGWLRLTGAIVEAGLIIHPTIFCWNYSTGFPKATRIDTQVDRRAGAERRTVGTRKHQPKFAAAELGYREKDNGYNSKSRESFDVTAPATELAAAWQGHRYGMQAMKPAIEPIIVFQKPYAGRPVNSITATGAGALNVDGGRVSGPPTTHGGPRREAMVYAGQWQTGTEDYSEHPAGRWPANFALVHHPACNGACHPDCVVQRLGEQSGESESKTGQRGAVNIGTFAGTTVCGSGDWKDNYAIRGHDDSGTAARFFHQSDWMAERLEEADAVGYFAKASRGEREAGLDPRQIALLRMAHDFDETTVDDGRKKSIDNPYQRELVIIEFAGKDENGIWVHADQTVQLQVDTAISPPKVIGASMIEPLDAGGWNMMLFGSESGEPSLLGSKSITLMRINSITESRTLNWLMRSFTNAYTAAASSDQTDGGSHAESVESSKPSISFILAETVSLPGVIHAASGTRWTISAVVDPGFPQTTINDGRKTPIDNPYQRGETVRRNSHPTIKPIALTRWLATLLLPPAMYAPRRLLVPFAGAGSEMAGAMLAGWEDVTGIELEADHVAIAEARLAYWQQRRWELLDPAAPITARTDAAIDGQLDMFLEDGL